MAPSIELPRYSAGEELAHSVSHGIGILLSIAALAILVAHAALRGTAWEVTAAAIFGTTLILMYVASTLYHAIPFARAKRVLRILDHASIYLLIAGTYTPFALGPLRGPWGWSLLALVWSGALAGVLFKSLAIGRAPIASVVIYVALGWSAVLVFGPLSRALPVTGLALVVGGGLCYTLGLTFYAWKSLRFHHAIWHLFVLAGSILHFFAVLGYAIPPRAG
ncbi:MAG: hemolysin III family protein [Thermoanaerobaculia bacterium]